MLFSTGLLAQPTVESIPKLRVVSLRLTDSIQYLFNDFCSINAKNEKNGDKVLELASFNFIDKMYSRQFYITRFECMSEDQRHKVAGLLSVYLREADAYFFDLVTLFKLTQFVPFLEAHVPIDRTIEERLIAAAVINATYKVEFELSCMAALASFNDSIADELIDIVNAAQKKVNAKAKRGDWGTVVHFYSLMQTIMKIPKRRKMVIETMSLFDVENVNMGHGVEDESFSLMYFINVISPLINDNDLLRWSDNLGEDSKLAHEAAEKIKNKIIMDDTIWKDYVKK